MAGNSWDVVESGGKRWLSGSRIEMLPAEERSSWSLTSTSVSTVWTDLDLTGVIGTDVRAVMGFLRIGAAANKDDRMLLLTKAVGASTSYASANGFTLTMYNSTTVDPYIGGFATLDCKGTDPGKIQYREYTTSYEIDKMRFCIWGRIRP